MARKSKALRYIVTGPGIEDGNEPSYDNPGPALSRATTAASKSTDAMATWYVRDAITGENLGYAERQEKSVVIVRFETRKVRAL